ncbi:MAG: ABC transporter permease [Spirochaetaceae bacterium]|jgi:ABC-2 type transport system permease protein|nr:ABC transporter permease [Spirochaetaceae bacterium]
MTKILDADFYKLRHNIGFKLLPLVVIAWSIVTSCFMLFIENGATVEGEYFTNADVFGFMPAGYLGAHALSTISNVYSMVIIVFCGLFISTEFTQGTIRNAVCAGVSRAKMYISKLAACAAMLALCMFVSLVSLVTGFTVLYGFGDGAGFFRDTAMMFAMQFLYHLTYAGIGCLLSFLIPNIAFAVAAGMVIVIFEGVLVEICTAFDALHGIAPLIPQYYVTRLNDNPGNFGFLVSGALVSIVFVLITAVIGCMAFRRQDIK